MSGSTGGNNKPWEFIIINDPEILREIPNVHSGALFTPNAPLAILVCGDLEKCPTFWKNFLMFGRCKLFYCSPKYTASCT